MKDFVQVKMCLSNEVFDKLWESFESLNDSKIKNIFKVSNKIAHHDEYVIVIWNSICWNESKSVEFMLNKLDTYDIEDAFEFEGELSRFAYQLNRNTPIVRCNNDEEAEKMLSILDQYKESKGDE